MSEASLLKSEVERLEAANKRQGALLDTVLSQSAWKDTRIDELEAEVAHLKRVIAGQSRFPKMGGAL